ncbi:MAG TPA: hypothetical protein PLU40_05150 [Methanoculleus sp.]|nr:hypothetical protein [Methanoculleus sp.]HOB07292.1 hypothetical protein [Methanoculleus sp.]HPZ32912.1 hypothetical protein [Methanoculleus sp.]HQD24394.1 hypothetical protein [Methanoculleus sp.]HRD26026.1 hypothetical protein [Methanoculleus sp.]
MKKRLPVSPMLVDLVVNALDSMDGVAFTDPPSCPHCGGDVSGYDMRAKRFAVVIEDGKRRTIRVMVKRFRCQDCGSLCGADAPFYPDTRLASPIVDLCVLLAQQMPFNRVAQYLREMRLVVDRGTIRNYASREFEFGAIPATDVFGLQLPLSLLNLATLTLNRKGGPIVGAEALAACGFPAADRTPLHPRRPPKERYQRYE